MKGALKVLYVGRRSTHHRRLASLLTRAGYVVAIDVSSVTKLPGAPRGGYELVVYEDHAVMPGLGRGRTKGARPSRAHLPSPAPALIPEETPKTTPRMTLKTLRETVGKTQGEVARKTAISQSQLSRLEARRDHLVSTLRKYARALGGDIEVIASVSGLRVVLRDV